MILIIMQYCDILKYCYYFPSLHWHTFLSGKTRHLCTQEIQQCYIATIGNFTLSLQNTYINRWHSCGSILHRSGSRDTINNKLYELNSNNNNLHGRIHVEMLIIIFLCYCICTWKDKCELDFLNNYLFHLPLHLIPISLEWSQPIVIPSP